jgi:hypothetical protein
VHDGRRRNGECGSGARAWLGQKQAQWLTPIRLRWITIGLFTIAVLVAGTLSGSS